MRAQNNNNNSQSVVVSSSSSRPPLLAARKRGIRTCPTQSLAASEKQNSVRPSPSAGQRFDSSVCVCEPTRAAAAHTQFVECQIRVVGPSLPPQRDRLCREEKFTKGNSLLRKSSIRKGRFRVWSNPRYVEEEEPAAKFGRSLSREWFLFILFFQLLLFCCCV